MTPDQEKLIRALASGESYHDVETRRAQLPELAALAQVLLETVEALACAQGCGNSKSPGLSRGEGERAGAT